MLTAAACQQVNEAINSRDLECGQVPEAICTRLADHIVGLWSPASIAESGPLVKVTLVPVDCEPNFPDMVRCWEVEAVTAGVAEGSGGAGIVATYTQRPDGTLVGEDGTVIGN